MIWTYWFAEVVWQTKAALLSHLLQAATASVDGVLGHHKDYRQDDERKQTKNNETSDGTETKQRINFVFHVGHNLLVAEGARLAHRTMNKRINKSN